MCVHSCYGNLEYLDSNQNQNKSGPSGAGYFQYNNLALASAVMQSYR
jgi:hypothetical protein